MNRMKTAGAVTALLCATGAATARAITFGGAAGGGKTELVGSAGLAEVARRNREAQAQRAKGKATRRDAVKALVQLSHESVVLGHIHPRWLRQAVEARIAAGETVTTDEVARWRRQGPEAALGHFHLGVHHAGDTCFADGRPCYVAGSEPHFRCGTSACGRTS